MRYRYAIREMAFYVGTVESPSLDDAVAIAKEAVADDSYRQLECVNREVHVTSVEPEDLAALQEQINALNRELRARRWESWPLSERAERASRDVERPSH